VQNWRYLQGYCSKGGRFRDGCEPVSSPSSTAHGCGALQRSEGKLRTGVLRPASATLIIDLILILIDSSRGMWGNLNHMNRSTSWKSYTMSRCCAGAGCRQTTVQHQHQAGQPLCCYEKLPACHLIAPTSHADSIGLLRGAQGRLLRCRTHGALCPQQRRARATPAAGGVGAPWRSRSRSWSRSRAKRGRCTSSRNGRSWEPGAGISSPVRRAPPSPPAPSIETDGAPAGARVSS
jgi:hypothetical protein